MNNKAIKIAGIIGLIVLILILSILVINKANSRKGSSDVSLSNNSDPSLISGTNIRNVDAIEGSPNTGG